MLTPPLLTLILRIESKRCELNVGGQRVYEMEMLLDPVAAGSPFFDRPTIERLIAQCEQSRKEEASLLLRQEYNAAHRYAIGTDTGKCNGNDYSTSVLIDFSTIPAGQVGSYANNRIPADQFAYELKRQADLFGSCPIAPEKNSESGGSCLTTLKMIYDTNQLNRQVCRSTASATSRWEAASSAGKPTARPKIPYSMTCVRRWRSVGNAQAVNKLPSLTSPPPT
jgi:hypothetical protein